MFLLPSILNWMVLNIGTGKDFGDAYCWKKKMGYINGKKVAFAEDDPGYYEWETKMHLSNLGSIIQ